MRVVGLLVTGLIAVAFFGGAASTLANYYFDFAPDKTSGELGTTMVYVAIGLLLGGVGAFCFVQLWKDEGGPGRRKAV